VFKDSNRLPYTGACSASTMVWATMGTVIPEIHRLSNLSVYSWMEGAAVASTTAVGAGAVVAGLSYAGRRSGHSSGRHRPGGSRCRCNY
jgi:hypothetical protein